MEGHEGMVWTVVYTDDPPGLLSGSDDGTVRLWDGAGIERAVLTSDGRPVYDLALDPDGSLLAITQGDQIWLRDVGSGMVRQVLEAPANTVYNLNSVAFSPDGALLAAGGTEHRIILWSVETGDLLATLDAPSTHDVQDLAFSPDGTLLASAALDGAVWLWTVP
jgi:WD40 repeat protein